MDPFALLDSFFDAVERADFDTVASFYADDAEIWDNITGSAIDKAGALKLLRFWHKRVDQPRYEVIERRLFDGGIVQRHVTKGTAAGIPFAAHACIVVHLEGGKIEKIFEYTDSGALAQVFAGV